MVKDEKFPLSWQHSSLQSPNLNYMSAPLQPWQQQLSSACIDRCMFSANTALSGAAASPLPCLKTRGTNQAHGLFQLLPHNLQTVLPSLNPHLKENQSIFPHGFSQRAKSNEMSGPIQKRFLIFDQSGNETRLLFSSVCSPAQNPAIVPEKPLFAYDLHKEVQAAKINQISPNKATIHEEWDEDHLIGEGSEMHENTEEIDALLCSDDDDYDEDDEVSTGRSPTEVEENYKQQVQVQEMTEEVASSGGYTKRQKLVDGGFIKSLVTDTASSMKSKGYNYEDDAESSCTKGRTLRKERCSIMGNKRSRKDRVLETLKTLESIIPGVKGKDPLLVLEEAIQYLKCLKLKAKALGAKYH